jgi:hypothetical protein
MTTRIRSIEEERRECRLRWAWWRKHWRIERANLPKYALNGACYAQCLAELKECRREMRRAAAARLSTAAREARAEANSSCPAHGSASLASSAEEARPRRWAVEFASLGGNCLVVEVVAGPDRPLAAPDAHTTPNDPSSPTESA